jgi:hypothetical protein
MRPDSRTLNGRHMTKFEILVARAQHAQDQCHAAEESGDKVKHLKALLTWASR